jgi:hypothetical protein
MGGCLLATNFGGREQTNPALPTANTGARYFFEHWCCGFALFTIRYSVF